MKKLLLILLLTAPFLYGQARNSVPDSITVHRTAINANADSVTALRSSITENSDSLAQHRTEINNLSSGVDFTGDVTFGDNDTVSWGAGKDMKLWSNGSTGFIGGNSSVYFRPGGTTSWLFSTTGNILPNTTSTYDIGASDKFISNFYADTARIDTSLYLPDNSQLQLGTGRDLKLSFSGTTGTILQQSANLNIYGTGAYGLYFGTNSLLRWYITSAGNFLPYADGSYDIGSNTVRPDSIYADAIETSVLSIGGTQITSTAAELNYTDGVTSAIQTQLDTKLNKADFQDSLGAQVEYINLVVAYPQTNQENIPIIVGNKQITEVYGGIQEGTSVAFNISIGATIGTNTLDVFSTSQACSTSTRQSFTSSINEDQINANQYVWLDIGTVTGTVKTITITLGVIEGD